MGVKDWFGRRPAEASGQDLSGLDHEVLAEVRELARERVLPGFEDRVDVVEVVADHLGKREVAEPRRWAEAVVDETWRARQAELAAAEGPDDNARLEAAFAGLRERGVLALMSFTCCQQCGLAEIAGQRSLVTGGAPSHIGWSSHRERRRDVPRWAEWGYVFFHQQDAERLTRSSAPGDPATLYLAFGSFSPAPGVDLWRVEDAVADEVAWRRLRDESAVAAGHVVVAALTAEGLTVRWGGTSSERVAVDITDWRRPLPAWSRTG